MATCSEINNEFYNHLGDGWETARDHPVALLRAENKLRIPWIIETIEKRFSGKITALDVGCGAGFLTNALAKKGHQVTGIDLSENSLAIAKNGDATASVDYRCANAYTLPFDSLPRRARDLRHLQMVSQSIHTLPDQLDSTFPTNLL